MELRIDPEKLIDISLVLTESTPVWPGDVPFRRNTSTNYGFCNSVISMSSHCGTHMDAPAHLDGCTTTIDEIEPSNLILPAVLIETGGVARVEPGLIEPLSLEGKALVVKTGLGSPADPGDQGHLSSAAARMAVDKGARLVGIDSLSVDAQGTADVHHILLKGSIPILENLVLKEVFPGNYILLCFPLRLGSCDGSPVRAFLHPV